MAQDLVPLNHPNRGGVLRNLPAVSIVTFATLSFAMAGGFGQGPFFPSDSAVGRGFPLGILFAVCGIGIAALVIIESRLTRIGREFRFPASAIIVTGFFLAGLGAACFWAGNEASHYRLSYDVAPALLLAYVTGSSILLAVRFTGYRPSTSLSEQWGTIIAAAHGLLGTGMGFFVAYVAVVGCQCIT